MTDASFHVFSDLEAASDALARTLIERAQAAVAARGRFVMSLAGGSTPNRLYQLLANVYRDSMPWEYTHIFWGDERFVPWNSPESNYYRVHETLLQKVPIPSSQVYRIITESGSARTAAQLYQAELMSFCRINPELDQTFDVALLGLGEDGHTASLFPENLPQEFIEEDEARQNWVKAIVGPDWRPPVQRITLTYAALNRSDYAFFLVSGASKAKPLAKILNKEVGHSAYPAAFIKAHSGVHWFVDEAAHTGM